MSRRYGPPDLVGGGAHFAPGGYVRRTPRGRPIDDVGPKPERGATDDVLVHGHHASDPRTLARIADHEAALAPRRWRPNEPGSQS